MFELAAQEIRGRVPKDGALADRVLAAMRLTVNHWLVTDDTERLKAAVGAVILDATEDEQARLVEEMRALSEMMGALQAHSFAAMAEIAERYNDANFIGIRNLWIKAKKEE